jgi:hypothetical protein
MNPPSPRRISSGHRRSLGVAIAAGCALVLVVAFLGVRLWQHGQTSDAQQSPGFGDSAPSRTPPTATAVCGRPILRSPYNYNGAAGPYSSGTAGLPTYGKPGSDFPNDTAGDVLPDQTENYQNWQLRPDTVYYLEPGVHIGSFAADNNDAFVGGYSGGTGATLSGNYRGDPWAIASLSAEGVAIEYLTIEKYQPVVNQVAINQGGDTGWTIAYDTITLNVPGGGAFAGTDSIF